MLNKASLTAICRMFLFNLRFTAVAFRMINVGSPI